VNRSDFIDELKIRLRKLPYDEIKEAVDYYEEYFDDAGGENEQSVLTELGSPAAVSSQIIAGFAVKGAGVKSAKKNWASAWLVILAISASPVAVPLAIAAGAVALAFIIAISALIFSFFAAGVALIAGGLVSIVACVMVVVQSPPTTVFLLGVGLATAGAGTAVVTATVALARKCFGWLTKQVGSFILRGKTK